MGRTVAIVRNLCRIRDLADKPDTRISAVFRILAGFEIALVISTWPLWWGDSDFPQVPLLPVFPGMIWSRVLTGLLLMSAVLILSRRIPATLETSSTRCAAVLALFAGLALLVLNQHRLQPWHWLFLMSLFWMLLLPGNARLTVIRHTICTVYVCSALSRISATPLSGMTGAIVFKSLAMLGFDELTPNNRLPIVFCHTLIVGELCVGLLLLKRGTRWAGCIGSNLLHVSLIIVLGPLGLNHHAGVLLWNLCFLCVVPVLFCRDKSAEVREGKELTGVTRTAIMLTWMFPLSGLIGLADNWPSWQLYSSRPENWILFVHRDDCNRLHRTLAEFTGEAAPLSDWCPIKLDRWSLAATGSPLYPEDRFQLAVCSSVLSMADGDVQFRIDVTEPITPFWWNRRQRSIISREEIENEKQRFILNTTAIHWNAPESLNHRD
jgi:hypothetical protein